MLGNFGSALLMVSMLVWTATGDYRDLNGNGKMDPYENPSLTVEERVNDLLSRMTLEEKIGQMIHSPFALREDGIPSEHFLSMAEVLSMAEGPPPENLKKGIQEKVLRELRNNFNLNFATVSLPDYESTVEWVESGKADLMLSGRFYGYKQEQPDRLRITPVVLHPTTLHFASGKGRNADLLSAIDKHLSVIMNDPGSVYYQALVKTHFHLYRIHILLQNAILEQEGSKKNLPVRNGKYQFLRRH